MKLLITGAAGLVGTHLIKYLDKIKSIELILQISPRSIDKRPWIKNLTEGKQVYVGDIRDYSFIRQLIVSSKPDIIIHLVAIPMGKGKEILSINYGGTQNIVGALQEAKVHPHVFIYISAVLALGDGLKDGAEEYREAKPRTPYEKSKWLSEELVREYTSKQGIRHIILRPVWIYGEHSINPDIINLVKAIRWGVSPIPISKDLNTGLIYAGDLAKAIHIAIIKGLNGTYNIRDRAPPSFYELVTYLKSLLEKRSIDIVIPKRLIDIASRKIHLLRYLTLHPGLIPIDKWVADAGYIPHTNLYQGLSRTINWLHNNGLI
jgi:nucleoside-diphosphate-sugar epimerase